MSIWSHRLSVSSWNPAPKSLAERVEAELAQENPAEEVKAEFMEAVHRLISMSRGFGSVYEELINLLGETGWRWDGAPLDDMPKGMRHLVVYNDRLSKLMILQKLIAMYGLADYEPDILIREINKLFGDIGGAAQGVKAPTREMAEQFIRRIEDNESADPARQSSRSSPDILPPRNARVGRRRGATVARNPQRYVFPRER